VIAGWWSATSRQRADRRLDVHHLAVRAEVRGELGREISSLDVRGP
jgi:hypothetical protein